MPRRADHAARRAQITDALVRVAAREGLHAVTMRSVAAEAGVSLRLVQYYFEAKGPLMQAALRRLEELSHQRWAARLERLPKPVGPRAFLEAFVAEALPSDEAGRVFHQVWTSYAVLAMTDPELARQPFVEGPDRLEGRLAEALRQAQESGELAPGLDAGEEAVRLLALSHGLGTGVLVGQRSPDAALAVLRRHVDRLFVRCGPAGSGEQVDG